MVKHYKAKTAEDMRKQVDLALAVVIHNHKDTPWSAMASAVKRKVGIWEAQVICKLPPRPTIGVPRVPTPPVKPPDRRDGNR